MNRFVWILLLSGSKKDSIGESQVSLPGVVLLESVHDVIDVRFAGAQCHGVAGTPLSFGDLSLPRSFKIQIPLDHVGLTVFIIFLTPREASLRDEYRYPQFFRVDCEQKYQPSPHNGRVSSGTVATCYSTLI